MAAPLVSVVIPAFNRAALAAEALESVFRQDLGDLEAVLVDDGSTDGTAATLRTRFAGEARLRLVEKENGGAASARNRGLDEAGGRFVLFLDSDDLLAPHAARSQVERLEATGADVVLCDARYEGGWKEDGQTVFTRKHFKPPVDLRSMLDGAYAIGSIIAARRDRIGALRFDEDLTVCEDVDFLMQLYAQGLEGVLNPEVLVRYRHHGDQAMLDDDGIRMGTVRVLEKWSEHADRVGATLCTYQIARRKARHLAERGRLKEARPYLGTWLRHRFSSRAFKWWLRSLVAR